jgi:hypothetical protein
MAFYASVQYTLLDMFKKRICFQKVAAGTHYADMRSYPSHNRRMDRSVGIHTNAVAKDL